MAPAATMLLDSSPGIERGLYFDKGHYAEYFQDTNPKALIGKAFQQRVESIDPDACGPGDEDAFFVADLGQVYRQHMRWKRNLPRVKPFFAVKSNPDKEVLRLLAELGTGFDCASKTEIDSILDMGVSPTRIIYAQPCKTNSYVRFAASKGVRQMTFDNIDELYKIHKFCPEAELFLRILTDDSSSLVRLSQKFGASMDTTIELLALAQKLGLNVVGVSFHIGSLASDATAFTKSVCDARSVFDDAVKYGFNLHTLDIGGGFSDESFESMAATLSEALDLYMPSNISIIAEPGRYYVASAFTLACSVIARRTIANPQGDSSYMIYLNDGIYGNFSSIMFDHQHPVAQVLHTGGRTLYNHRLSKAVAPGHSGIEYSIWGQSCDGIDRITECITLPKEHDIDVGDWLYFEEMGAYTRCSATKFNGFRDNHDVVYICTEASARALLGM